VIWWQQWGSKVDALQEIARRGQRVAALEDAPQETPDMAVYLRCYGDVSTDRSASGYITFHAVALWCQVYGVSVEECWHVVREADSKVKEWLSSSSSQSRKPKT
jgi:hypothetical protein